MTIQYPWAQLKQGSGFFVPGLDLVAIREEGLRLAVGQRLRVKAQFGLKGGLIGVWFYRPLPILSSRAL